MKRLLITTALEETWGDGQPVLFLGEWCRRYSLKDHWSKMDAEVLPYHWNDRAKLYADYQYLREFYERLLRDLSAQLNISRGTKVVFDKRPLACISLPIVPLATSACAEAMAGFTRL